MVGAVLASLRPRQWVKNLFVLAGLVFGQQLFTPAVWTALGAFLDLLRRSRAPSTC